VVLHGLPDTLETPAPRSAATGPPATDATGTTEATDDAGSAVAAPASPPPGVPSAGPAPRGTDAPAGPTRSTARGPEEQIARRDAASRQDAKVLAAARAKAAKGALATLRAQIEAELSAGTVAATAPVAAPTTAASAPAPAGGPAEADDRDAGATLDRAPRALPGAGQPLLEVRPSPVATDLDRLGDRLAVYEDRVSMLDRHDNVRQRIDGHEIADVVLAKRFTGWVVTIEAGSGETIVVKGLRHDQAEEVRDLIMRRTRRTGPAPARPPRAATPATPAEPASSGDDVTDITDAATPVDSVRLLALLDELHEARLLTDDELAAKRDQVARLAAGKPLTVKP
jgi:hypothetical protein